MNRQLQSSSNALLIGVLASDFLWVAIINCVSMNRSFLALQARNAPDPSAADSGPMAHCISLAVREHPSYHLQTQETSLRSATVVTLRKNDISSMAASHC